MGFTWGLVVSRALNTRPLRLAAQLQLPKRSGSGYETTEEYRQTLQNMFGISERVNDVMESVKWWIDGR